MEKWKREIKKKSIMFGTVNPLEEDVWNINPDRCTKRRFTKEDAKRIIKQAKALRKKFKGHRRGERGIYYCKECCAYHVTSRIQGC